MPTPIFCDRDFVKTMIADNPAWTSDDALFDSLIAAATDAVQKYCRRNFIKQEYIEYRTLPVNRTGRPNKFFVKEKPLDANVAVEVKIGGAQLWNGGVTWGGVIKWDEIDALTKDEDYTLYADRGIVEMRPIICERIVDGVRLRYTGGYALDDGTGLVAVPEAVKLATAIQTAFIFDRIRNKHIGRLDMQIKLITRFDDASLYNIVADAATLLRPYRWAMMDDYNG